MGSVVAAATLDLLSAALRQDHRTGISEMLRALTQAVDATGCILWQETPLSRLDQEPPLGEFFVLAEWFPGNERCNLHNLPLRSATGQAILSQQSVLVNAIDTDPRSDRTDPFLTRMGIRTFCSLPLIFLDQTHGALNAYRNTSVPFTNTELVVLQELAHLLPSLYQTITDKVSYRLIREVNSILHRAGAASPDSDTGTASFEKIASTLCSEIAQTFDALEVSLFLEDPFTQPGLFNLYATTWPDPTSFTKKSYSPVAEGLTGWVLEHKRPVKIFDLAHFEQEQQQLQALYPRLTWGDSLHIQDNARRLLGISSDRNLQPLSLMAVPVLTADRCQGAIRISCAKTGPYYFSDHELALLCLVADQIAQAWTMHLHQKRIEEENRSWRAFVESVGHLNKFVQNQVAQAQPDEKSIFEAALAVTDSIITGAEITDIRLLDEERRGLYFVATRGQAWEEGDSQKIRHRLERYFPIDLEPPGSAGAYVVKTGRTYVISDTLDERYYYSPTFPQDTRRMICAPIGVEGKVLGVLDIRGTTERDFPRNALSIVELLGQQLGLYHYLLRTIAELQRLPKVQAQTYEDFAHQLKSPMLQVHSRVQAILRLADSGNYTIEGLRPHLLALRGLASKAKRVGQSLGLFAELAANRPIRLKLSRLRPSELTRLLIECASDQMSLSDPARHLDFAVERDGFDVLESVEVEADRNLLFQAVSNLLDNAGKYSYPHTTVKIYIGLTGGGRFQICIVNHGLPLRGSDVKDCRARGWQGLEAKQVAGEGSGIGLWVVDHIMRAHKGELIVVPTNSEGDTEFKLIFPIRNHSEKRKG
jgi:GAF domain-containing protein